MFHTFITKRMSFFVMVAVLLGGSSPSLAAPELLRPLKELFQHKAHEKAFQDLNIGCTDCHLFSQKEENKQKPGNKTEKKPESVKTLYQVCHHCHRDKVTLPVPKQCTICHKSMNDLQPRDHSIAWRTRHGKAAGMDRDSCTKCHAPQTCSNCHLKLDTMNPRVHSANFRLYHSVEARANPQSCTTCHHSLSFCVACHTGRK